MTAYFADGSSAMGDVLVGADGANSAVRRQYRPGTDPVPTGSPGLGWTVPLLGDAVHAMPPAAGNGANMAFRDASLLHRNLADAARGSTLLLQAIGDYESDMRDYAFSTIRTSMTNERLGLNASPLAQFGMRAWFRICDAFPAAKRASFGESWAKDARPRLWELQPANA